MRLYLRRARALGFLLTMAAFRMSLLAGNTTIDFETPALGDSTVQTIDPYVAEGVTFTAIGQAPCVPVVGLVRESAVHACATGLNQALSPGYGWVSADQGVPIRASFPPPPADPVTAVSVDVLTIPYLGDVSLTLHNSAGTVIGESTIQLLSGCDGGFVRTSLAASAPEPVAFAMISVSAWFVSCEACGCCEFCWPLLIDNFTFGDCLDAAPPTLSVSVSPTLLWPPNHKLVGVHASVVATDDCDSAPQVTLLSIASDEPDHGPDLEDLPEDIRGADLGAGDFEFDLRAERLEGGDGRTYTVCYEARDARGHATQACSTVEVPHERRGGGASAIFERSAVESLSGSRGHLVTSVEVRPSRWAYPGSPEVILLSATNRGTDPVAIDRYCFFPLTLTVSDVHGVFRYDEIFDISCGAVGSYPPVVLQPGQSIMNAADAAMESFAQLPLPPGVYHFHVADGYGGPLEGPPAVVQVFKN